MICFYHSKDLDGHCSGAIVRHRYPDCKMIGIDYADEFPFDAIKGEDVIMTDFSLQPFSGMIRAAALAKSFLWIDHHKSAIEAYGVFKKTYDSVNIDTIKAVLDSNFAACELTWKTVYPDKEMPISVKLLGRYDVWDKTDPNTDAFQLGIKAKTTDPADMKSKANWDYLLVMGKNDEELANIVNEGDTIQFFKKKENADYAKDMAFDVKFEDLTFVTLNMRGNSQTFDSVYDPKKHDGMLMFYYGKDKQWHISLYSTKTEVDVSAIAKKHGGGGHAKASGFSTKELPFLDFY